MKTRPASKTCPVCGKGVLHSIAGEFKTDFEDHRGARRELVVPDLRYEKCDACGEEIFDQDASNRISDGQRAALGLLSVDDIRGIRHVLGRTQREMSELLGIGDKTYCRWESGTHFQSEAFDRYLRLLRCEPRTAKVLERIRNEKSAVQEPAALNYGFEYLGDIRTYESLSFQFNEMLQSGPFYRA
jgi:putative zinc finger/helix-turn-helix YgiT family protein